MKDEEVKNLINITGFPYRVFILTAKTATNSNIE